MKQALQTIENGNLKIINVPVNIDGNGQEFFSGRTTYAMAHIFRYMIDNGLNEYNFNDYTLNK